MTLDNFMLQLATFKAATGLEPNTVLVGPDDEDSIPPLGLRIVYVDGLKGIEFAVTIIPS